MYIDDSIKNTTYWLRKYCHCFKLGSLVTSVTRLGDFLHFGQPFKAFDNNNFAQISYILSQFL